MRCGFVRSPQGSPAAIRRVDAHEPVAFGISAPSVLPIEHLPNTAEYRYARMAHDITRTVLLDAQTEALRLRRFLLTDETGQRREFSARRVRIGSHHDNDFVLDDRSVSRQHARIEVDANGYRLIDCSSKNGTHIRDTRIHEAWLKDGDTLHFGEATLRFDLLKEEVEVPLSKRTHFGKLRGRSEPMREVFGLLERVAPSEATVLIQGDSGTGKELVAQGIHDASARKKGPFIVFDCSAVSPELIESELFGHVKGAYTGANTSRAGAFEQAHGGTLFIDELGALSLELQPKLLRALEERQIRRVGGNKTIDIDARIVAATNTKLRDAVAEGTFRKDLYYRFAVITIDLPPLRDRPDDIPLLVEHFVQELSEQHPSGALNVSFQTMEKLKSYHWPGNIRELRNFVERAALLAAQGEVDAKWLPETSPESLRPAAKNAQYPWLEDANVSFGLPFKEAKANLVEALERAYWAHQLEEHDGNLSAAARSAGVHRKTAEYLVRKVGLRSQDRE